MLIIPFKASVGFPRQKFEDVRGNLLRLCHVVNSLLSIRFHDAAGNTVNT